MHDELSELLRPEKIVKLPGGGEWRVRQLLMADWPEMTRLYAKFLVGMTVMGAQPTDELVQADLPALIADTFMMEQTETPGAYDSIDLLKLFLPEMTPKTFLTLSGDDFTALFEALYEFNRRPFGCRRPAVMKAVGELLTQLGEVVSLISSLSPDALDSIPVPPASPSPISSPLLKRKPVSKDRRAHNSR